MIKSIELISHQTFESNEIQNEYASILMMIRCYVLIARPPTSGSIIKKTILAHKMECYNHQENKNVSLQSSMDKAAN
jgi:hypothetical protein